MKIGPKLSLNTHEIATSVSALLGMRGKGKTNLAFVICEKLLDDKYPVLILDTVGLWHGLRLAPDGKHPSPYKIPILGGLHADLELSPAGTWATERSTWPTS